MKKINFLTEKDFFKKPNLYGVVHIKTEFINQGNWNCHNFEINFGKPILDNCKWDKIIEG